MLAHAAPQVLIVDDERDTNDLLANLVQARKFEPIRSTRGLRSPPPFANMHPRSSSWISCFPTSTVSPSATSSSGTATNLIPVIMVTALNDANHRAASMRVGANGYLTKPFTTEQLFDAIDKAIASRKEHEERGTTARSTSTSGARPLYLVQANNLLADLFRHTPLTERQIKDLRQAIMEMGGNAIEWGHRKNADLVLQIIYRIDPQGITLVIRDQGPGFNPTKLPHAAHDDDPIGRIDVRNELGIREGGFGIMLAKGLLDDFRYNEKGNEVTLVKRFDPAKK